jgi:ferric hydroxamate transport system substrate-binding protein
MCMTERIVDKPEEAVNARLLPAHGEGAGTSRRLLLRLAGAAALAPLAPRSANARSQPSRIAVFDWGLAETLLALGVAPIALCETAGYRQWVIEPALPPSVADAGLRIEPNFELIASLRPDLILTTPELEPLRPMLERIGRCQALSIYRPEGDAWDHAGETVLTLSRLLGREADAQTLLRRVDASLEGARARIAAAQRPLYLVNFIDGRHVRIYGKGSIFQTVLDRLGLTNAYTGWTSFWGFATLGIEHLAANPDAQLLYLEPLPVEADRTFREGPLWAALPFVREGRIGALPPVWSFGGIASGERLARLLGEKLAPTPSAAESGKEPS